MAPGRVVTRVMYSPARTAPRNPYPYWHTIYETLPLLAQNLGPNPYPYWHKSTKRIPFVAQLLLKNGHFVQLLADFEQLFVLQRCLLTIIGKIIEQLFTFYTLPRTTTGKTIPFLSHIRCSQPYPEWHFA